MNIVNSVEDLHVAKICWSLPNQPISSEDLPQALAALTMDTSVPDVEWTTDTGASNHMTTSPGMLLNPKKYVGHDCVFIGDGSSLKINAIGDTLISDGKNELLLHDVLHVPQLTRNLLSVSQLTSQYPLNCEFTDKLLCIKERATGRTMLTGQRKGDLYVLSKSKEVHFSNRQNTASEELWHQRLGHPQKSAVQLLQTQNLILVSSNKKINSICESCQLGKLSKLPFTSSSSSSTTAFEKIHCDIWGPGPVLSLGKFRYYACFIDDYSHYIWLHPLRSKSDFVDVYLAFESYVQHQFDKKIKVFHSDGSGEFVNNRLSSHFRQEGIIHQLSCPIHPNKRTSSSVAIALIENLA